MTDFHSVPNVAYDEIFMLLKNDACIHPARSLAQADLYAMEWENKPALLKDFSRRPWIVRVCWSRFVLRHELAMMCALQHLEGIPALYAKVGQYGYIMQRLDAAQLPPKHQPPSEIFWKDAKALIKRFHEAGFAHGDLRRKNIMIGPENQAYLIDFATTMQLSGKHRRRGGGLRGFLFRHALHIDQVTFARIKASYGASLDEDERRWLASAPWWLGVARFFKKNIYGIKKSISRRYQRRRQQRHASQKPQKHIS